MKQCMSCAIDFQPKNPKGIFCSAACRQKDYRIKIATKLAYLKTLNPAPNSPVVVHEMPKQVASSIGIDLHSKKPNKSKIVVYMKEKPIKDLIPANNEDIADGNLAASYESLKPQENMFTLPAPKSFRDYMDLLKSGNYNQAVVRKEVQEDKKLNSNQKSMIYSKLK